MNVRELKKRLNDFPDDLELFVDVEFVEEEDCDELPLTTIRMSVGENGTTAVLNYDTPYM